MGISYQTRNRLRRKVHTAPLSAPAERGPAGPSAARTHRLPLWPLVAALAVAATAFAFLYRT